MIKAVWKDIGDASWPASDLFPSEGGIPIVKLLAFGHVPGPWSDHPTRALNSNAYKGVAFSFFSGPILGLKNSCLT